MTLHHIMAWVGFLLIVLSLLALDLFVLHRKPHEIKFKEALFGEALPVVAASLFGIAVYFAYEHHFLDLGLVETRPAAQTQLAPEAGVAEAPPTLVKVPGSTAALDYFTGYLVEVSLSADNVFLFVVLMGFFRVPKEYQHRVLFWGVLGALVMRGIMIIAGAAILKQFGWVIYIFGAFLVLTGIKMIFSGEPQNPSDNIAVRTVKKIFPIYDGYDGKKFFTKVNGKTAATTLFIVLVCIEFTDLVFALDSIPAIFGITQDPFIVFSSNVFAILGLRSMYFLLAGVMDKFHLLKYGLAFVLAFVGVKMLLPATPFDWHIGKVTSLSIILGALALSVVLSLMIPSKEHHKNPLE